MRPPPPSVASQQQQHATTKTWHDDEVAGGGTMTRWHNLGPNDAHMHVWAMYIYGFIYLSGYIMY